MNYIRLHFFPVFVAVLLVSVVALAVVVGLIVKSSVQDSELRLCHRLNILRASENRAHRQDFEFDRLEYVLVLASLKHQTGTIKRTAEQERQTGQFVGKLKEVADGIEWTALTKCHDAVYTDKPPANPVRFSERLPPSSVYAVGRGQ